ncbi:MAG: tetratricopeptide repeat protein, partial [Spirochaetes bacterium]|nr:tetratricopeptide repeat protein [Spirochaetota bacterium]
MKRALRQLITLALVSACALSGITENERNTTVNAAITLFKQRNYDGVIAKLSPITLEINDIKPAVLCLAESYYYKKKFVSAEKLYAQALTLSPDADEEMTVLTALGNIYVATKDFTRGIPVFEKLLAKKPNDIVLTFNIAVLYKFKGEIPLAVKYLETVLAADPGYVDAVKYLVAIHQEANDEEKAIAVLSSALAKTKSPAIQSIYNNIVIGRNFRLGNQYFERKEYQFAVKMFEEIIAIDATATGVIFKLANAYFNNSDYEKALVSLKKLETNRDIIGDAENAYPFFKLLALTLYQLKQYDALTETGKKALAYNPGDYDILRALGRGYEMRGDYAKAIAHYIKAVELKQDFRVLHWLSVLLAKDRRYADAMNYLARAVNNGYKDADALALYKDVSIAYYTGMGNDIYNEVKDTAIDAKARTKLDSAAGHYRKALDVERRPVILISLANTAILRQQFGEAETLLTEARTIDSNNVSAYLSLARMYSEQKLPKQQAAVLAELEKLSASGNPDVIYQIAVNYEQSGDQVKAFDLFTRVRSNTSYTARANEHLAVITYNRAVQSFNEKRLDEAERLFREIVQYQPESKDAAFGLRKIADERKRRTLKETVIAADTAFDNADYAAAISRYESALAVDDTLRTVALNLASSYFKTKNYYNAVSIAQNLLAKNQKDKEALVLLARAATRLNDIKNAETYFKRALAIDNNDGDVHRYLGELNRDRGDTDTAIREFRIAKELALKDIENY